MASKKKIIGSGVDVQTSAGVSALVVDETTGAVSIGSSSPGDATVTHTINGAIVRIDNRDSTGGTDAYFSFRLLGTEKFQTGLSGTDYFIYSNAAAANTALCSSAGAWTFGPDASYSEGDATRLLKANGSGIGFRYPSSSGTYAHTVGVGAGTALTFTSAWTSTAGTKIFSFRGTGNEVGTVSQGGSWANISGGSWDTISDSRLKKNVEDLDSGLVTILAMRPVKYAWKDENVSALRPTEHFIAQEVELVNPKWVTEGGTEKIVEDGVEVEVENCKYVSLDASFNAYLVKAIQEQQAMIEELKAKVAALEAK